MNMYMTDNEQGQSISCALNPDGSVSIPHKSWNGVQWYTFTDWQYPIREPATLYEMHIMSKAANR